MNKKILTSLIFVFVSILAGAIINLTTPNEVNAYTNAQVNSRLYGGIATAYRWDQSCYDRLQSKLRDGYRGRNAINLAGGYQPFIWVSGKGKPSQTTPVEVDYGATVVPLQINFIMFLCASLTRPSDKGATFSNTSANGVIQSASDANERAPGFGSNFPAMSSYRYRINSATVETGGGTLRNIPTGGQVEGKKSSSSRYWFASPLSFNYENADGIKGNKTIKVNINVTRMATYYSSDYACIDGMTSAAVSAGHGWEVAPGIYYPRTNNYNHCKRTNISFTVSMSLNPYYLLEPSVTLDRKTAESNDSVSVRGFVQNEGTLNAQNVPWQISRFVVPAGSDYSPSGKGGNNSLSPRLHYGYGAEVIDSGSSTTFRHGQSTPVSPSPKYDNMEDFPVGTKVCYALSVRPHSATATYSIDGDYRHSDPSCVTVSKRPKVQIWGGDLLVGRTFTGASLPRSGSTVETSLTIKTGAAPRASDDEIRQKERATQRFWYFGHRAGLDFGNFGSERPTPRLTASAIQGTEGTTVAVNSKGEMQFFTDGLDVYRANGARMPSGQGVGSTATTTQAAASFPLANNRYAVIVTSSNSSESSNPSLGRLYYSIVDMNINDSDGQRGRVTVKRQAFGPPGNVIGEALSVVPSYNPSGNPDSAGYWVVTNEVGSNRLRAHKVMYSWDGSNGASGEFSPVISATGVASGQGPRGFGAINFAKFDTMNDRVVSAVLAMSATSPPSSTYLTDSVRVLNFDRQTGSFQERLNWRLGQRVYTADFSPDGSYVYVTSLYNGSNSYGNLYRYSIFGATTRSQVEASVYKIADAVGGTGLRSCDSGSPNNGGGHVKRGPDGRMYVANWGCNYLGVVNNPDATNGSAIGWQVAGRSLSSGSFSRYGLPQMATSPSADDSPVEKVDVTFGSWIEYGIFAPNYVNGTGSGSGLNGGRSGTQASWSNLTFANDHTGSNAEPCASGSIKFGCYSVQGSYIPDVISNFPVTQSTPRINGTVSIGSLPRGVVSSNPNGSPTINLTGGEVGKGRWHVINAPNATVNIRGNITYTNETLMSTSDIPQLIIIAKDINISGNVSQVDAWLVAIGGSVVTCSDRGTASDLRNYDSLSGLPEDYRLSIDHCSNILTINGPVMAESLWLRRTGGSGVAEQSGDPAEIINLRPDAYLWASEITKRTPRAQTVFTIEDAPRL